MAHLTQKVIRPSPLAPLPKATVYTQVIKPSQVNNESPPSPQFWGNKKIKFFQSPPELGDLGGLDKSKRRQLDLCVHDSSQRGRGEKKNSKPPLAPLLPFWEKGLGDEGGFSICVR
jgi:hypothetical protein